MKNEPTDEAMGQLHKLFGIPSEVLKDARSGINEALARANEEAFYRQVLGERWWRDQQKHKR